MVLDPTKHADWEIAQEAESRMKTCYQLADALGLTKEELLPHGNYVAKVDYMQVLQRLKDRPDGKFIEVTAITPAKVTSFAAAKASIRNALVAQKWQYWLTWTQKGMKIVYAAGYDPAQLTASPSPSPSHSPIPTSSQSPSPSPSASK